MTNKEACGPCARRKVRCDRHEPSCANCRRRKGDRCVYPPISPKERIRRLEALVRRLGGDPDGNNSGVASNKKASSGPSTDQMQPDIVPVEVRSGDPMVIEEDGHTFYVESRAWQDWLGKGTKKSPFTTRKRPHAFTDLFSCSQVDLDLSSRHPSPEQGSLLWAIFYQRVEPLVRITFRWRLQELRARSVHPECLSGVEHGFVLAIYLISIVSLLDEECDVLLHESKPYMLLQYHALCEEALLRTNLFCMNDITVIKALIFYMMASFDRLVSSQSLWSLMGLVLRNAEKLGLHRDGLALGLLPEQTEERRRVWWQLQHIDLLLGIWAGSTPMTLMADWDAKLPLNIEDDDITPSTVAMPRERRGLTSISYCRYTYWALDTQRQAFRAKQGRFALSWQSNVSLAPKIKEDVLTELEEGLNKEFLQYCDPIKPLDNLLQLVGRFLIVGLRLRILHGSAFYLWEKQQVSEEMRTSLFDASVQCLKYNIAIQSDLLKHFCWYTRAMFSWHAFMFVLVEASRENDILKAQETWDLLANVYATNSSLFQLSEDRRRHHAAELVVAAWKTWQHKRGPSAQYTPSPHFVIQLEAHLASFRSDSDQGDTSAEDQRPDATANVAPITSESTTAENVDFTFDMDFQDIDWCFWSSME